MLLSAAKKLAQDGNFSGVLHLIFQPAEEHPGGVKLMIEQGLFERFPCDAIFAIRNMPGAPQGQLVFRAGAAMASSDDVTITITGTGGHGAMPHLAADPVVAASSIVMALQTVASRNVDPQSAATLTVGAFSAGRANNVIPQTAKLELSVRPDTLRGCDQCSTGYGRPQEPLGCASESSAEGVLGGKRAFE